MTSLNHENATCAPTRPRLILCHPRGFCAGVDRAIQIVERALNQRREPLYVRHEIVHNRHVVEDLEAKGAVFVESLDDVPDEAAVIFSAHGVARRVPEKATARGLTWFDATCPLVSKVHHQAQRWHKQGYHILLIGHAGHPEVEGTMGQLPEGAMTLIEDEKDLAQFTPQNPDKLALVTQTTLSVDDTADLIARIRKRFPGMEMPKSEDICYATSNRQMAVKAVAPLVDHFFVIGARNSSNSNRLVEVARQAGCADAQLIADAAAMDWARLGARPRIGVSAGASAPESLVQELVQAVHAHYPDLVVEEHSVTEEQVQFNLPRSLRDAKA